NSNSSIGIVEDLDFSFSDGGFFYWHYENPQILYTGELIVVLGAFWKLTKEYNEMSENGLRSYLNASGSAALENSVSLLYCFSIFFVVICNLFSLELERVMLALACISGWSYIFFFL